MGTFIWTSITFTGQKILFDFFQPLKNVKSTLIGHAKTVGLRFADSQWREWDTGISRILPQEVHGTEPSVIALVTLDLCFSYSKSNPSKYFHNEYTCLHLPCLFSHHPSQLTLMFKVASVQHWVMGSMGSGMESPCVLSSFHSPPRQSKWVPTSYQDPQGPIIHSYHICAPFLIFGCRWSLILYQLDKHYSWCVFEDVFGWD